MRVDNVVSSLWYNIRMAKSLVRIHQEIEKQKPFYKAMNRLHNWYAQHPHTPADVASRIDQLHERVESEQAKLQERHARELLPILETVKEMQEKAKALGLAHRQEKEDITMAFAIAEFELLSGKITVVPEELKPIDSRPGKVIHGLSKGAQWLRETFTKPVKTKVVNSEA